MSKIQDSISSRKIALIIGVIAIITVAFFVMRYLIATDNTDTAATQETLDIAMITERVGQVIMTDKETTTDANKPIETEESMVTETPVAVTNQNSVDGEAVYNQLCVNCHGVAALAAMIPQAGDVAAWEPRIKQGIETLYQHSINGFVGNLGMMPAKGGNPALSDEEVKAAVDYMVSKIK